MQMMEAVWKRGRNLGMGSKESSLLHVYQALIRSSIDYGCAVYGARATSD